MPLPGAVFLLGVNVAVGWFLVPYKRRDNPGTGRPGRYCAAKDFAAQILADGGAWKAAECLGNHAVVKVRASNATLSLIAGEPGVARLPKDRLTDPLSDLTVAQRNAVQNKLLALGYTNQELQASLTPLTDHTLVDVLRFALTRRLKPRFDSATDTIVLDGPEQPTALVESVDEAVVDG